MTKDKAKEYGSFNFPNELSEFEQYYYYLVEFNFIPKEMHPGTVLVIFNSISKDFLEGFLKYNTFVFIFEQLYYGYVMTRTGINKKMENLMDELAHEFDHDTDSEAEVKKKLEEYLRNISTY